MLSNVSTYFRIRHLTIKKIAILNFASTPTLYTTNNQHITPNFATLQTLQVPISHKTKFFFSKIVDSFSIIHWYSTKYKIISQAEMRI